MTASPVHATRLPGRLSLGIGVVRIRHVLLAGFLVLSLRTLQYFPGLSAVDTAWLVILFLYGLLIYIPTSRLRFGRLELYALAVMLVIPLYSALMAYLVFGQPPGYGVLAQRAVFFGFGALALSRMLRSGRLSVADAGRVLVGLGWATLAVYLCIRLTVDPAAFAAYPGFVGGGIVQPYEFKFKDVFIVYAFFHYGFAAFRENRLRCYVAAAVFFTYLVVLQGGRSAMLSIIAVYAFFTLRWGGVTGVLTYLPKLALGGGVVVMLLFASVPDYMNDLVDRTQAAISVVTQSRTGEDASANARITERALVAPYIEKRWLVGNGDVSNQWRGGYQNLLSGYFYPSDIGIFGVVFVYGIAGALLFAVQFRFARRAARRLRRARVHTRMSDALVGYLLFAALHSLVTGAYVWRWEVTLAMVVLLHWLACGVGRRDRVAVRGDAP